MAGMCSQAIVKPPDGVNVCRDRTGTALEQFHTTLEQRWISVPPGPWWDQDACPGGVEGGFASSPLLSGERILPPCRLSKGRRARLCSREPLLRGRLLVCNPIRKSPSLWHCRSSSYLLIRIGVWKAPQDIISSSNDKSGFLRPFWLKIDKKIKWRRIIFPFYHKCKTCNLCLYVMS